MGADAKTTNDTSTTVKAVSNVMMKNSAKCSQNTNISQVMTLPELILIGCDANISDISQEVKMETKMQCIQKITNTANLRNDIKKELENMTENKIDSLSTGSVNTDNINNTILEISNTIDIDSLLVCTQDSVIKQVLDAKPITAICNKGGKFSMSNIKQSVISKNVAKCIQNQKSIAEAATKLDEQITNSTKNKMEGLLGSSGSGSLSALFASPMMSLFVVCIISLCSVCSSMLPLLIPSGGSGPAIKAPGPTIKPPANIKTKY